jgi:hypothetical protein
MSMKSSSNLTNVVFTRPEILYCGAVKKAEVVKAAEPHMGLSNTTRPNGELLLAEG